MTEAAVRRFNRIGSEGTSSHTVDGESMTWAEDDFALFNDIYGQYFVSSKPARSCFQVAKLPKDGLVEIEVVAAR